MMRHIICGAIAQILLCSTVFIQAEQQLGLVFPNQYYVDYNYALPYTLNLQYDEVSYQTQVWYDLPNLRLRVDYNSGLDSILTVDNKQYTIFPVDTQQFCFYQDMTDKEVYESILGTHYLPNVTDWDLVDLSLVYYQETNTYLRKYVYKYQLLYKLNHYIIYTSEDGATPVMSYMLGTSYIDGSHYDKYAQTYNEYIPGAPDADFFKLPEACTEESGTLLKATDFSLRFAETFGSKLTIPELQKENLLRNKQFIDEYNQNSEGSHTLKLNRFAAMSDEQFFTTMLPRKQSELASESVFESPLHMDFYEVLDNMDVSIDDAYIPDSWDWRGTGVIGPVLDQADCGSCWSFGAAQTMSSSWYMATGDYINLSEQQIVDCAWEFDNYGCDGGFPHAAIEYVVQAGGIAALSDYLYRGIDEYCKDDRVPFSAYFEAYSMVPSRNVTALQLAIMNFGPVAISIDAAPVSFRFHDKGVYYNPKCGQSPDDLDHSVVAVGWGADANGVPYWIVKNSWSTYWGDEGYIYVAMDYDCGVTTSPVVAIVDFGKALKNQEAGDENQEAIAEM